MALFGLSRAALLTQISKFANLTVLKAEGCELEFPRTHNYFSQHK